MIAALALMAAKAGLSVLAPKAGNVINNINKIAEIALPIVSEVAQSTSNNDTKWASAVAKTSTALAIHPDVTFDTKDHLVESGVQLAYSILKAKSGK